MKRCKFCEALTRDPRKDFCCPGHKVAFSMKQYSLKHPTRKTQMSKLIYRAHDVAATKAEDDDIMIPGTEPQPQASREEVSRPRFLIGTFRLRVDHAPEADSDEALVEDLINMLTEESFELDTDRGITATILDIRLGLDIKTTADEISEDEEETLELPDDSDEPIEAPQSF